MANFAALIAPLSISGSRKSDGTANASGQVWFFQPGGNTPATVYKNAEASAVVTQPVTLTNGGLLNRSSFPDGIFATRPIRLLIQDSTGSTVSDTVYIPATAGNVGVDNEGWSGSTLDEALTAMFTSLGGTDGQYLIATGQTNRPYNDVITEISISVKAFGAVGDGVAIDTTAIQAALNFAKAAGGGIVYFPPGTYKIDQAITLTSATGVSLAGAGPGASVVRQTHASANGFTFSTCTSTIISGLTIDHNSTSTGTTLSFTDCVGTTLINVQNNINQFLIGLSSSGVSGTALTLNNCNLFGQTGATGRGIVVSHGIFRMFGGGIGAPSGTGIEFTDTASSVRMVGVGVSLGASPTARAVLFNAALTGTKFYIVGCDSFGSTTTPFDLTGLATDPALYQAGNGVDGAQFNVASGGTATPIRIGTYYVARVRATSTGAASTIAAPTPAPAAGARGVFLVLEVYNNAGGAITGWTMNAIYHLSAGPSTTDTEITSYLLNWDGAVWRQISRSVTT